MNKEKIIAEKLSLVDWALSLKTISTEQWLKPFRQGAWGTADVIAHFISWDKFMIENRIAFLLRDEDFPIIKVNVETINKQASDYARSGISKEELIHEFISIREQLISLLGKIPTEKFNQPFPGNGAITLSEYFAGMIDHDSKHKEQIDIHLKQ
jgi:hypothetical protein